MKFPKIIRHRKAEVTIYGKKPNYPYYRIAYRVAGKRHLRNYSKYGEALKEAEKKVRELADGSPAAALTADQSRDALAAIQRLESLQQSIGRRVSLLAAVSEFAEASVKLQGRNLGEVVEGYLNTLARVKHKSISDAVADFIASRDVKTKAAIGNRAELSKDYHQAIGNWLRKFAQTFPGTAVSELTKDHIDIWAGKHSKKSPRTRNSFSAAVKMFIGWCVRKDYLKVQHRLFEAQGFDRATITPQATEFYTPAELLKLLEGANREMLPVIVLGGLAGLRLQEALRLTWTDIFNSPGHITISATKSKTRSRRLVQMVPALEQWLKPYREEKGPLWSEHRDTFNAGMIELRKKVKVPMRKNGLRHAFCTYHYALHLNENLTAAQAGNSPAMIHQHYKGLATKAEAEEWFAVMPKQTA